MKFCRNQNINCGFELSSVVTFLAYLDIFRLFILHGLMIVMFRACLDLNPMYPESRRQARTIDYVLYSGSRENLSSVEQEMVHNVEKVCGKEYRNGLPEIWAEVRPTLVRGIILLTSSVVLPALTSVTFLVFPKKDKLKCILAVAHFCMEVGTMITGLFGAWFFSDSRLCFLASFDPSYNIHALVVTVIILTAIVYKSVVLYSLHLYITTYCKMHAAQYKVPTPEEELKTYLKELRQAGITPRVNIDIPPDRQRASWNFVNTQIKKALQDVRMQVAELHKDDPLVSQLLASGKFTREKAKRKKEMTEPGMLKIAEMMRDHNEYKLLTHHQHHPGTSMEGSREGLKIILPEPGLRDLVD